MMTDAKEKELNPGGMMKFNSFIIVSHTFMAISPLVDSPRQYE